MVTTVGEGDPGTQDPGTQDPGASVAGTHGPRLVPATQVQEMLNKSSKTWWSSF